ncbi:MAG: peptidoglycan DD-metalloendopeptidase family protein [Chloroflexaceae bacterium]|nr:peptidoglycan DD-metalloendopeptidase family protein [Chloroflexaceae bacterium]
MKQRSDFWKQWDRQFLAGLTVLVGLAMTVAPGESRVRVGRDDFFDPHRLSYEPDFYQPRIALFLDAHPGPLKAVRFQVGRRSHTFADVLVGLSSLYSLNPTILLALLEQQSRLLSTAHPSAEQMALAMGFEDEGRRGLHGQVRWAALQMRLALRDYAVRVPSAPLPSLVFADGTQRAVPASISLSRYVLSRVLAPTTSPDHLPAMLETFLQTYTRLFGDPRIPPTDWPHPAQPFLTRPMERPFRVTSFFDHETPLLHENGTTHSFWGQDDPALSYDGHTGWDYAMQPPDRVLAAAGGTVVFAGNSNDGCAEPAQAVILDHANGYRTLYWHLHTIEVEVGQTVATGTPLGVAGATGCATGPHLHFQVQYLGRDVDPYGWCGSGPDPWAANPAGQVSVWLWADMPAPCGKPPAGAVVVDATTPGFAASGGWHEIALGYGGTAGYTTTMQAASGYAPWQVRPLRSPSVAVWQPVLPQAGRYRVLAYIPFAMNGLEDARAVGYRVHSSEGEAVVTVDSETLANSWADLGSYRFDPADRPLVRVSSLADEAGKGVWADAVMWVPEETWVQEAP